MQQAARDLQFEEAAVLRDRIRGIKENLLFGGGINLGESVLADKYFLG